MDFLTSKEVSKLWGISPRRVTLLCKQGRVPGAVKAAGVWILPKNAEKPDDARITSGAYVGWRNPHNMVSEDFQSNIKNLQGTVAVENMTIGENAMMNLERLEKEEATCFEIVEELKQKYMQER